MRVQQFRPFLLSAFEMSLRDCLGPPNQMVFGIVKERLLKGPARFPKILGSKSLVAQECVR